MARNIVLTLGLISIPVKVDSAIENTRAETGFKTVCTEGHDPAATKQTLACPVCNNDARSTFKKGKPTEDGGYVVVEAEEVKEAAKVDPQLKNAMTLQAHPLESVLDATVATGKVYNLLPGKGVDPNNYATIVEATRAIGEDGLVLCTVWAYRDVPSMYLLQSRGEHLVAHELARPETVKAVAPVGGTANAAMVEQFKALLGMAKSDFDPEAYRDTRVDAIKQLVDGKQVLASGDPDTTPGALPAGASNMADQLAAALKAAEKDAKKSKKKAG